MVWICLICSLSPFLKLVEFAVVSYVIQIKGGKKTTDIRGFIQIVFLLECDL